MLPNFVAAPFLPNKKLNLGLDLRGGSQLLLEIDYDKYQAEQLGYVVEELRKALRSEQIGYKNLGVEGTKATFELRDPGAVNQVKTLISSSVRGVDVANDGVKFSVGFNSRTVADQETSLIEQSIEIIRRRVDETGTKEPIIQTQGKNRILLQVPGVDNPEEIKKKINTTAKLDFHSVKGDGLVTKDTIPDPGYVILPDQEGHFYEVQKEPVLGGQNLTNASQGYDNFQHVVINFTLDSRGAKTFGDYTRDNVGQLFVAVLDNVVVNAARIHEVIMGGQVQISGNFTVDEANNIASLLRAGALPVSLKILEERTVGASLGADSIHAGTVAAIIATALVALFMIATYGFFGVVSVVALTVNLILIIAFMSLFQATLTLPGIAGITLTTGIAVDANVLIFERIREELRNGKKPFAAVEQGFDRAFSTIFDANITALASAVLLYIFGTGTVKGFAVSLSIGIISSMFTAIMLSRFIITLWLAKRRPAELKL